MPYVLPAYLPILVFMVIAAVIAVAMVGGSLLAGSRSPIPKSFRLRVRLRAVR